MTLRGITEEHNRRLSKSTQNLGKQLEGQFEDQLHKIDHMKGDSWRPVRRDLPRCQGDVSRQGHLAQGRGGPCSPTDSDGGGNYDMV